VLAQQRAHPDNIVERVFELGNQAFATYSADGSPSQAGTTMPAHCRRIYGPTTVPTAPNIYGLRARLSYRGCVFMPDRFAEIRHGLRFNPVAPAPRPTAGIGPLAAVVAGIVLAGAMLGACSSSSDTRFSLFAEPGKYQYHTCVQIAAELKNQSQRRQDLKALMDKADQGAGGAAVGFIAYKAEYVAAGEELESLHSAARGKNCEQDETWRSNTVIR
jgi:hypothetical protein